MASTSAAAKVSANEPNWVAIAQRPIQGIDALTKAGVTCTYRPHLEAANAAHQYLLDAPHIPARLANVKERH